MLPACFLLLHHQRVVLYVSSCEIETMMLPPTRLQRPDGTLPNQVETSLCRGNNLPPPFFEIGSISKKINLRTNPLYPHIYRRPAALRFIFLVLWLLWNIFKSSGHNSLWYLGTYNLIPPLFLELPKVTGDKFPLSPYIPTGLKHCASLSSF